MRLPPCLAATVALIALAVAVPGQCTVGNVTFQSYGTACNTVFGVPPSLSGSWNPQGCSVRLTVAGFQGCCNTFLQQRLLAVGVNAANLPVPQVGPTCSLYVQPDIILSNPGNQPDFDFVVPPGLPALTLYAQGATVYFTTIGLSYEAEMTNGLAISIQ